jgi:hypothetical protein
MASRLKGDRQRLNQDPVIIADNETRHCTPHSLPTVCAIAITDRLPMVQFLFITSCNCFN